MDKLTAKLVDLIEKGEAAAESYTPILTSHWVNYVLADAIVMSLVAAGMTVASFFAFKYSLFCFKKGNEQGKYEGDGWYFSGLGCIIASLVMGVIGLINLAVNLPIAFNPIGYLVHRFVT